MKATSIPKVLSVVCLLASAAISVVIMVLNASFWAGIGNNDRARFAFAVGVVALDCMKVTLLPLAAVASDRRLWAYVLTAVSFWVLLTSFSLYSAWSFAQRNSGAEAAELARLVAEIEGKQVQLQKVVTERGALPRHRHASVTGIELGKQRGEPKFEASGECLRPGADSKSFCVGYRRLTGEHEVALLAAGLEEKAQGLQDGIRELRAKLNRLKFGNPASEVERAFRWAEGDGWMVVNAVIIGVFEIAAGVGVYLALRLQMRELREVTPDAPSSHWELVPRSQEQTTVMGRSGPRVGKTRIRTAKKVSGDE